MIRAHRQAVLAKLQAVPQLTTYDGLVPNLPEHPYVVLWMSAPNRLSSRMCGVQSDAVQTFATTAVATDANQIGWVQEKVHGALVDAAVTVTGRSCERVKHEDTAPIDIDYDVDPPVLTAVDIWRFLSIPA